MRIEGATALVTGGARGLGAAFTATLLDAGARHVYAASRRPGAYGDPRVTTVAMDVTDAERVETVAGELGEVSLVVNNAGSYHGGTGVLDAAMDDVRADMETNLFGVLNVTRSFAPVLARHDAGAFVNVHALLAWMSAGDCYSVSKAATWGLSNAVRAALVGSGIQVLGLHVGFMDTDMVRHVDVEKADPHDVARLTLEALARGDSEVLADAASRQSKRALAGDPTGLLFG